jgi:hypothetical protein
MFLQEESGVRYDWWSMSVRFQNPGAEILFSLMLRSIAP